MAMEIWRCRHSRNDIFILLFVIPRSPRWLVKKGKIEEARGVLKLIGEQNYEQELQEIIQSIDAEHVGDEPLFIRKYRLPIFLAITIGMFNQLSGINAILYYLNDIFASAGFNKVSSDVQAVFIGGTNLAFTMLAMTVIDKLGRKKLLLIGAVGTAICLAGVAGIFLSHQHQDLLVWLLVGYIAFFSFSQGAVIWVYIGEVFPNRVRAKGQRSWEFLALDHEWDYFAGVSGNGGEVRRVSIRVFPVMMAIQFVVVLLFYPETKGHSLEELQKQMGIA